MEDDMSWLKDSCDMTLKEAIVCILIGIIIGTGVVLLLTNYGCTDKTVDMIMTPTLDTIDRLTNEPPLSDEEVWRAGVGEGNL